MVNTVLQLPIPVTDAYPALIAIGIMRDNSSVAPVARTSDQPIGIAVSPAQGTFKVIKLIDAPD